MTNIRIMQKITDYVARLNEDERKAFTALTKETTYNYDSSKNSLSITILTDLFNELKEDERKAEAKKSGKGKLDKVLKQIEKDNLQANKTGLAGYHKFNDKFAFLNGYYLIISNNNLGYEEAKSQFDVSRCMQGINKHLEYNVKVNIANLKEQIKLDKIMKNTQTIFKIKFDNDTQEIGFNSKYLLNCLEAAETDTIYFNNKNAAAYFENVEKDITGIVLPVRL